MPTVRIELLEGRSPAVKQQVADEVTEMMCRLLGAQPGHVYVMFDEYAPHNWAVGGSFFPSPTPATTATTSRES
ncbi:MAG: tautomerase family protein [Propionibacteriaceae bacterium]|nr:tautomerase family protein [Propionibacteriaceae bacterium]